MKIISAILLILLPVTAPAAPPEAELPLTRVAAFSSGVGYFEHRGTITGDGEVQLRFSPDQMNDILKSLVVLDAGGWEAATADYPSREPLERALEKVGVDLSDDPTPGELLGRLRGHGIRIETPEKLEGKILTVETRTEQIVETGTVIEREYLSLLTTEGVRTIPLDSITSFSLTDQRMNAELNRALGLLAENLDSGRKPFSVLFRGEGTRTVRIGYITEMPVWKASYRLVLEDGDSEKALLQGWAIVENTGDYDWEAVELTLVSGRPVSFIQDLYTPLYLSRPVVEPELYSSLAPRRYEEGLSVKMAAEPAVPPRMRLSQGDLMLTEGPNISRESVADLKMREVMEDLRTGTSTGEAGELFSYRVGRPVSLPRGESALLPIINRQIAAEKVSIYNADVLPRHPLNGIYLTNNTEATLPAGPVTVYDGDSYGGDGQIGNLTPGTRRLLSYAIDLKLTVDSSRDESREIAAARISRGNLEITRKNLRSRTYRIGNSEARNRAVIIEHPRRKNLELVEPDQPLEETEDLYHFRLEAKGDGETTLTVREEAITRQTVAVLPCDPGELVRYSENGEVPVKVRAALAETARRKNLLSEAERALKEREHQRETWRGEQDHVRKNMEAVAGNSPAYSRFEKKLLEQEARIEDLQKEITQGRELVEQRRRELAEYVAALEVD